MRWISTNGQKLDNFNNSSDVYEIERIEGELFYLRNHPYPFKNAPTEGQMFVVNILKEMLKLKPQAFIDAIQYVIKYDWAYRFRFLDLCNETTTEALQSNPRKEIKRLMQINERRDLPQVHAKLNKFASIVRFLLLYPPFKRRFKQMAQNLPKPDESDKYWMKQRKDYHYGG